MMGGKIWVESNGVPGQGSTFHFTACFGLRSETPPPPSTEPSALKNLAAWVVDDSENQSPLRILIAEDNVVSQRFMVAALEKQGHTMVVAGNGQEAVTVFERESFDLILMDVQMPEMNGFEATAAIRKKEQSTDTHIPIIAMTAHAMKGDRERCLAAGMDAYVPKPLQVEILFEIIANIVPTYTLPLETNIVGQAQPALAFGWNDALAQVEGDEELLRELVDLFSRQLPDLLAEIQEAIASREGERLRRAAHRLKSSVGIFGAKDAFEAVRKLEMMGRDGDFANIESVHTEFEAAVTRMEQTLTAHKNAS
jgi:two-component system sensor histidine kinase/response regulator